MTHPCPEWLMEIVFEKFTDFNVLNLITIRFLTWKNNLKLILSFLM